MARLRESLVMESIPPGEYDTPRAASLLSPRLASVGFGVIIVIAASVWVSAATSSASASSGCAGNSAAGE